MTIKRNLIVINKSRARTETIFDEMDISETTKKDYSARVGLFLSYVGENGFQVNTYLNFKRYLARREDYTVATKNKYLATARVFLRELSRRGMLPLDVTYNVKQFRQSKRHRKVGLTDKEVQLMGAKLQYLPDTPRNSRLGALFSLLAFQGLRQIEIVRLDVEDVDLIRKIMFFSGKGMDDKEAVYLVPATTKALKKYMRMHKLTDGALFKSMGNRKSEHISTMMIKREMGELFRELGIEKTVHGFRHFYVTELLKSMDIRDVRKFSRHRSMEMLIIYDDEVAIKEKTRHVFRAFEKFTYSL